MQFYGQQIKPAYLRLLGGMAMVGAPWILIDFVENGLYDRFRSTSISGVHNLLFMTGCMCSVVALYYLRAAGEHKTGQSILRVQLLLLAIANCWNIYEIVSPHSESWLFGALSFSWPVACVFLIVTGIFVIRARRLKGWRALLPLLAGLWFPIMGCLSITLRTSLIGLIVAGWYAAVVFLAWGFSFITLPDERFRLTVK